MKVVVLGSGGREHALCTALARSDSVTALLAMPGSQGIAQVANCIPLAPNTDSLVRWCQDEAIDLVVIGPEAYLVDGASDALRAAGIPVFGPGKEAAQLESSKAYTKQLCAEYHIPTAAYQRVDNLAQALECVKGHPLPIVLKEDGLAAGKGVAICEDREAAIEWLRHYFATAPQGCVVIEEYMEGQELSFFALCSGQAVVPFNSAVDYKRIGDGNIGPNTGGMGSISPAPMFDQALSDEIMQRIITPTVRALQARGITYQGVLFAGLMLTKEGPKLIEYNARFGDPETQSMLTRLEGDLLPSLLAVACGEATIPLPAWSSEPAMCVVMASPGYPGKIERQTVIHGLDKVTTATVYHAGTRLQDDAWLAVGGRVLGITARGANLAEAKAKAYAAVDAIDWPEGYCRKDIGSPFVN
jgi:phosphoribosylamine--glycine ligase